MRKILIITNTIAYIIMIAINYLSNTSIITEYTIKNISDKYENLFTPAGYAFSIWGLSISS